MTDPQLDTVEPWLQDAERELGAKEETGSILGEVAACRAYQARLQGDVPRTVELSRRALRVLPEDDPVLRGVTLLNLGIAHRMSGDVEAAGRILVEAEEVNREAGNIHPTLVAVCNLALLEMVRGSSTNRPEIIAGLCASRPSGVPRDYHPRAWLT